VLIMAVPPGRLRSAGPRRCLRTGSTSVIYITFRQAAIELRPGVPRPLLWSGFTGK